MKYIIEPIGASFGEKDVKNLAARFSNKADEGYRLHSVFQASQPAGCLGGQATSTYFAIYEREESA